MSSQLANRLDSKLQYQLIKQVFEQTLSGVVVMLNEEPVFWSKLEAKDKEDALLNLFKTQEVVECNQAFANHYGAKIKDLIGKTPAGFLGSPTDEYGLKLWRDMLDNGKLDTLSNEKTRKAIC